MLILALIAAISLPPKPDHFVTDRAGVIANPSALDAKLAQFERETSDQILVYVDQHLPPDTTIEEMGSEAIKQWGVGQKGKDNGAILFVFVADRKMRIEVGYGLEGSLTDAKSKRIIETVIKPEFQRGNYSAGIEQGTAAIVATIRGEPYKGTGGTVATAKKKSQGAVADAVASTFGFLVIAIIFLAPFIGLCLLIWVLGRVYKSNPGFARTFSSYGVSSGGSSSSWSSSGGSSSSSSSSSSSFSGGGGSGGGGGASGSW
jgi:uncharacterized protein